MSLLGHSRAVSLSEFTPDIKLSEVRATPVAEKPSAGKGKITKKDLSKHASKSVMSRLDAKFKELKSMFKLSTKTVPEAKAVLAVPDELEEEICYRLAPSDSLTAQVE